MATTTVNSSTFLSDVVNLIRDKLNENIVDPLSASRNINERFVMTSYPRRNVRYPMITVVDSGTIQSARLGMQSEETVIRLGVELRIWARNVKERDMIFDEVYTYLRTDQFGSSSLTEGNLHDFNMDSVVNIDEESVKSKVMEINFLFVTE